MTNPWGKPAQKESEKRKGGGISEPSEKKTKTCDQSKGAGGGDPEMDEAPTHKKKSPAGGVGGGDPEMGEASTQTKKSPVGGVGGGDPEMGEASTQAKKSHEKQINYEDVDSPEVEEMVKKFKGNPNFYGMESINKLREEEQKAKDAEWMERKDKVKSFVETWALARL